MGTSEIAPTRTEADGDGLVGWLPFLVPGLIWGTSFLFIAEGLESFPPMAVTFLRVLFGFATLSLFPASRRPVRREDRWLIVLLGVIWMAFPLSMFPFAEQHVSSALTGMLNGATPLFVTLVAAGVARRAPSRSVVIGLAVGVLGAVLIAAPGIGDGSSSIGAVAMILIALVSYGFALNLTGPLGVPKVFDGHPHVRPMLALISLGCLGTGAAYVMLTNNAGRGGAARASASTFLIPVVSLVLGVVIRGDHVAVLSVIGCGICLLGAAMLGRARSRTIVAVATPVVSTIAGNEAG